jgi:flagellar basal body-associated protein FliL
MPKTNEHDKEDEDPLTPSAVEVDTSSDRKKKIKRLLIIVAPIILAIVGAIYFFFFIIKAPKSPEHHAESAGAGSISLEHNTYLDIDQITVGLIPTSSKKEFLRLDMVLRLGSEEESKSVMQKMPIIKDSLIVFLRSLRATDFNNSNSSIYLKEEVSKRINKITAPVTVKEVLFQEITVN